MQLLTGQNISASEVSARRDGNGYYRFSWQGTDITNEVRRADKLALVPGFDIDAENRRLSEERGRGGNADELPDSTLGILVGNLVTDPLGAPLESLENKAKQIIGNTGVQIMGLILVIALLIWMGGLGRVKGILKQ